MKVLSMLLLMVAIVVSGVAIRLLPAVFNLAHGFFAVASTVFLFASVLGLLARLRA